MTDFYDTTSHIPPHRPGTSNVLTLEDVSEGYRVSLGGELSDTSLPPEKQRLFDEQFLDSTGQSLVRRFMQATREASRWRLRPGSGPGRAAGGNAAETTRCLGQREVIGRFVRRLLLEGVIAEGVAADVLAGGEDLRHIDEPDRAEYVFIPPVGRKNPLDFYRSLNAAMRDRLAELAPEFAPALDRKIALMESSDRPPRGR